MSVCADSPYSFLIGLKRINSLNSNDGFKWVDGSSVVYSQWYDGEPNNGGTSEVKIVENCVIMGWFYDKLQGLAWTDVPCNPSTETFYVCQRDLGNV